MAKQTLSPETAHRPHAMTLTDRKKLSLTGVNEVTSFDEKQLILRTEGGQMLIGGTGLHVTALLLEEGRVSVEGQVDSISYTGRSAGGRKGLKGLLG